MPVIRLTTGAQKGDKFRVKTRFFWWFFVDLQTPNSKQLLSRR
jgi:hypothetical protein